MDMGNRKAVISISVTDDRCFNIEFSRGFTDRKKAVAESTETLVAKVSAFLKEFSGGIKQ